MLAFDGEKCRRSNWSTGGEENYVAWEAGELLDESGLVLGS